MMDVLDVLTSSIVQGKKKQTQNLVRTAHQTRTTVEPTSILEDTSRDDIVWHKILIKIVCPPTRI
jgi:hypothetical protein